MVDFEQLETVLDRDEDGNPVAYGVRFRDAKPHKTLSFLRSDGESVHMYVYVDKDYLPVAMSLVHPPTKCVAYKEGTLAQLAFRQLVLDLFGFLCQLSTLVRSLSQSTLKEVRMMSSFSSSISGPRGRPG